MSWCWAWARWASGTPPPPRPWPPGPWTLAVRAPTRPGGPAAVDWLPADVLVLVLGEMGIGNPTAASAVAAVLLDARSEDADALVGAGTGVTGAALARKRAVVRDSLARVGQVRSPEEAVRRLGGRDIAALFGAAARACELGMAVRVACFIVSTAILALVRATPATRGSLFFAHRSAEPGHR